jgi:hypothetical protein
MLQMKSTLNTVALALLLLMDQITASPLQRPGVFEDQHSPQAAIMSVKAAHSIRDIVPTPTSKLFESRQVRWHPT